MAKAGYIYLERQSSIRIIVIEGNKAVILIFFKQSVKKKKKGNIYHPAIDRDAKKQNKKPQIPFPIEPTLHPLINIFMSLYIKM